MRCKALANGNLRGVCTSRAARGLAAQDGGRGEGSSTGDPGRVTSGTRSVHPTATLLPVLFPDRLIVRVVMAPDWRPVCGVGIKLTLHAAIKNHYHMLGTTDARGEAVFTREFVEAQIDEDKPLAGMDYSSSLAECSPVLRVRTMEQD